MAVYTRCVVVLLILFFSACSDPQETLKPLSQDAVILAFGDSLTYGTGANTDTESYPAILQKLSGKRVINAGIPGEISQAGLARLPDLLNEFNPSLVILCHGGNDIIRRLDKAQLKSNLQQMLTLIKESGAEAVLVGVPTFGFGLRVPELYLQLAQQHQLPIESDVLVDIESDPALKSDPIHPNVDGYAIFGQHIYRLLQQAGAL